jgi:hypothetical protein
MDESQSPSQPFMQQQPQPQQQAQQPNQLGGMMQGQPPQQQQQKSNMTKQQLIAGLHHFNALTKQLSPILKNPDTGKTNVRPKIFDASAALIGQGIFSVPEVMNGIKDLPDDPLGQKKWIEKKLSDAMMAEKKLISDYIGQGPGPEPQGPDWSEDTHKEHMAGLMGNYKRG